MAGSNRSDCNSRNVILGMLGFPTVDARAPDVPGDAGGGGVNSAAILPELPNLVAVPPNLFATALARGPPAAGAGAGGAGSDEGGASSA